MPRTGNQKTTIIIHHTASPYSSNPDQFNATNNYHKERFQDIPSRLGYYVGYTYEISKNGTIHQARNEDEQTVAVKEQSMNFKGISICLDGEFDKLELPTDEQCKSLLQLIREVQARWNIPDSQVFPHRHFAIGPNGKPYKMCFGARLPDNIISYLESRTAPPTVWDKEAVLARARANRVKRALMFVKKIFSKK